MSEASRKRGPRLGRGLSSLMSGMGHGPVEVTPPAGAGESVASEDTDRSGAPSQDGLRFLPVNALSPNPHQPRQRFDAATITKLAASIKADGVMQPIVVRPAPGTPGNPGTTGMTAGGGMRYELVAGERRWRAAREAGLELIPALVRPLDDRQSAEWSLIENLQREDLNPIDRAEAFKRLGDDHKLSHDQVAQHVGLERSTVSNLLRLLALSDPVRDLVRQELLSMGQARAIAGLTDAAAQEMLAGRAVREGLSVREVEKLARQLAGGEAAAGRLPAAGGGGSKPAYLRDLEKQLAEQLGTRVHLTAGRKKGSGKMTIEFFSLDQFDAIVGKLGVNVR